MKTSNEPRPIMIFAGTKWETGIVKKLLENVKIKTLLETKNLETLEPWIAAPGGVGSVKVFVSAGDAEKAGKIVTEFKKKRNEKGE